MNDNRSKIRFTTDLEVTIVTVLESKEGRIVDLSEGGAQIMGASFPSGTRLQIDYLDQTLYARVMWDEVDRMGVAFEYPMARTLFAQARARADKPLTSAPRPYAAGNLRPQIRNQPQFGFGRRSAA